MNSNNSYDKIQQVDDNEELYRRVIVKNQIVTNSDGSLRPSSALYSSSSGDISVDIASKTTPQKSKKDAIALAGVLAQTPKSLGYPVVEDPLPENPAHALIKGKITKGHAREIVRQSFWVIKP
jgi:hypothetical protein